MTATGWWWPLNSKKAHYIGADGRSLCGRWLHLGSTAVLEDHSHHSKDNCAECKKRRWAQDNQHRRAP
jgi:hypothetical protein